MRWGSFVQAIWTGLFLPMPWQLAAGILPTYWPAKLLLSGQGEGVGLLAAAGLAIHAAFIVFFYRRFTARVE
ncbi:hypothetical protein [Brevibacillus sp. H7]|uniref:hypothetical protein n=1 Tax=Brevibacillus sp. H7 TaxID=3349138 RepID=UPI0037F4FEEE